MQIQVWTQRDKTPGKAETISATGHKYNSQAYAEKKDYQLHSDKKVQTREKQRGW